VLKWLTVIGFAATPALIFGQTAAWGAGLALGMDVWTLAIVIILAGFAEGLVIVWLAVLAERIPRLHRWLSKLHAPRFDRWFERWGVWTGLAVGPAVAGQEPVIIALVWLGASPRRMILPLALSNALYTAIYYVVVKLGWDAITSIF
jgi:membrane protein YqaA with SNARE-associated domain